MDAQLDHVVLLLPYQDIVDPPDWLTANFVLSPGGKHADGKTENRLILFSDGTYLELIAFIDDDPQRRHGHWWDRDFGVVDYALTTTASLDQPGMNARLSAAGTGISYAAPQEGGRLKPDGQELKWKVTFPRGVERGAVPFWCHDLTPRDRRVPTTDENTTHPCGVSGMAGVILKTSGSEIERLSPSVAAILNVGSNEDNAYRTGVPRRTANGKDPYIRLQTADAESVQPPSLSLVLQGPEHVPEIRRQIGRGLVSIVFDQHM